MVERNQSTVLGSPDIPSHPRFLFAKERGTCSSGPFWQGGPVTSAQEKVTEHLSLLGKNWGRLATFWLCLGKTRSENVSRSPAPRRPACTDAPHHVFLWAENLEAGHSLDAAVRRGLRQRETIGRHGLVRFLCLFLLHAPRTQTKQKAMWASLQNQAHSFYPSRTWNPEHLTEDSCWG